MNKALLAEVLNDHDSVPLEQKKAHIEGNIAKLSENRYLAALNIKLAVEATPAQQTPLYAEMENLDRSIRRLKNELVGIDKLIAAKKKDEDKPNLTVVEPDEEGDNSDEDSTEDDYSI